jgi:hypothetical protein
MNRTEQAIKDMKESGYGTKAILDALCDGEALAMLGLDDSDQEDIECAYDKLRSSAAATILGRKGGSVKTEKKARSSAENGKLGGRPKKIKTQ